VRHRARGGPGVHWSVGRARGRAAHHQDGSTSDRHRAATAWQASSQRSARRGCGGPHPRVVPCQDQGGAAGVTDDIQPGADPEPDTSPVIGRAGRITASGTAFDAASAADDVSGAEAPQPPRGGRRGSRLITILLSVLLVAVAAVLAVAYLLSPPSATPTEVEFEVLPGWGGTRVAEELESAGLVRSAPVFGAYLRFKNLDRSVDEGLYDLTPAMSSAAIAERLVAGGRPRVVSIVVPEGWRAANIVERLAANGVSTAAELQAVV